MSDDDGDGDDDSDGDGKRRYLSAAALNEHQDRKITNSLGACIPRARKAPTGNRDVPCIRFANLSVTPCVRQNV